MDHDQVVELLHDFYYGSLDDGSRAEIQTHLASCEDCRALSKIYRMLHASLHTEKRERGEGHPSPVEIVAYAVDQQDLGPEGAARVADHLKDCAPCSEEVDRTRKVDESVRLRPEPAPGPWSGARPGLRRPASWVAIAAAILLAALAYPAFLGLFELPGVSRQAETLQADRARMEVELEDLTASLQTAQADLERFRDWTGAVDLNVLSSSLREGDSVPTVTVAADQPYGAIAVEILLPRRVADSDHVRFEIGRTDGETAWSLDLPVSRVRADIRAWGVVTLLVPASLLEPGRYQLRALRAESPETAPLLRVGFDLVQEG